MLHSYQRVCRLGGPKHWRWEAAWQLKLGVQPRSSGRPFTPDRPPSMEFHLLNVEEAAGSPVAWLPLFLSCVGASRARGSQDAETKGKAATWVYCLAKGEPSYPKNSSSKCMLASVPSCATELFRGKMTHGPLTLSPHLPISSGTAWE